MFIGLIGETYTAGLSAMWVMVGWVVGDYLMWMLRVPDRLRMESEARGTVTHFLLPRPWGACGQGATILAGMITLVFLGMYAAAQLNAGSKALHVLFDWDYQVGAVMGALIVVIYCFAGGIRASIWTDVAQSVVMFVAMIILCPIAVHHCGGVDEMWNTLGQTPALVDWQPESLPWGVYALHARLARCGDRGRRSTAHHGARNGGRSCRRVCLRAPGVCDLECSFRRGAILVGLAARAW